MIIDWLDEIQKARLTLFRDRLDAGNTPGKLLIYTGPKPTPGNAITTQILLGTITFVKPSGTITGSVFMFSAPPDVMVVTSGLAAWGRFQDGEGFWVGDTAMGLIDSGAFIQADRLDWIQGSKIGISLATLSESTS